MYNPLYSKTHQYSYVQTEIAAGADEDTVTFYTTMRQTNKPIIVFSKNIFIILISYFLVERQQPSLDIDDVSKLFSLAYKTCFNNSALCSSVPTSFLTN